MRHKNSEFTNEDMDFFKPTEKIGLVATINEENLPHITMITSMQASHPRELLVGEFFRGKSKKHFQEKKHIAFLILSLKMKLWRGNAAWTHAEKEGPEFEIMNQIPMFRYNTYFGIETVHYFDLKAFSGPDPIPLPGIAMQIMKSKLMRNRYITGSDERVLKPFIEEMINKLASFTFLSYIDSGGFPQLIPILQCQAADSRRLIFSKGVFRSDLDEIPEGSTVTVFTMTMNMESILVRGTYSSTGGIGKVDINWVYNSMVPAVGQVYPEIEIATITNF